MKPTYDIYSEYQNCIKKLVWHWVKRSRFGFDELLSEANMAFIKAVDSYKAGRAGFHTHLYITVNGNLRNYCNPPEPLEIQLKDNYHSKFQNPEQTCTFNNLVENLSSETREMVDTVLNTPAEMIELVREMSSNRQGHMHLYRSNVKAYFKAKGWKKSLILSCFNEIKQTFS